MCSKKRVLYTGAFRFPQGDAAALRVLSIAELFRERGDCVEFAGWESAASTGGSYTYRGYDCFSQGELRTENKNPVLRLFGFLFRGWRTLSWLLKQDRYDVVVVYNPNVFFALGLLLLSKIIKFRLVLDTTEWYESSHLPGGRFGIVAFENFLRMRFVYRRFNNVISISCFLTDYFSRSKLNIIRIPPLLDVPNIVVDRPEINEGVRFIYAGNAGKKDSLIPFICVLSELELKLGLPLKLYIAGLDLNQLKGAMKHYSRPIKVPENVVCLGRVSRSEVLELYSQSHFSILYREDARYAHAGFPTKAVESWAYGCPLITNAVADLSAFSTDMKNSIVLDEKLLISHLESKLRAILLSRNFREMSRNSYDTYKENFVGVVYRKAFIDFYNKLS